MANENVDKISMSREALNVLLEEAELHGAQEAQAMADRVAEYDEDDFRAQEFIKTFEPEQQTPLGVLFGRALSGWKSVKESLREKAEEFNAFEAYVEPYYAYADDPEAKRDELSDSEYSHYCFKHEIYQRLHEEKLRRFGLFGLHRGIVDVKILD